MRNLLLGILLGLLIAGSGGCRICSQCDLDAYGAYGGRWQRTDRSQGRVGSIFRPAGAQTAYESDESDDRLEADGDIDLGPRSNPRPTPLEELPEAEPQEKLEDLDLGPLDGSDEASGRPELETALLERMLGDDL